ncbi:Aspartate aminotransferase, cytoplasmic, partial [Araneus ventricosus]
MRSDDIVNVMYRENFPRFSQSTCAQRFFNSEKAMQGNKIRRQIAFAELRSATSSVGSRPYRTDEGQPWVLPVVRKTEKAMADDDSLNHEYLGQLGLESFSKAASKMLLGEDNPVFKEEKVLGVQTLSGTGALRLGADFLAHCLKSTDFYMSAPTWPNHRKVFIDAGFKNCHTYRYWNAAERNLDFKGMKEDLE